MELEVNRLIVLDPFLPTGNTTCLLRVSFLRQKQSNIVFRKVLLQDLCFFIYINDLINALEKSIVHRFADDTNLLYGNKDLSVVSDVIDSELKLVADWLRPNKLSLNESKTKLLLLDPLIN